MSYLFDHFFKDWKYWVFVSLGGIMIVFYTDLMYEIMSRWFVVLFLAVAFLGIPIYFYTRQKRKKNLLMLREKIKLFEKSRIEELRRNVTENREFRTFCSDCSHYDPERRACALHLYNRKRDIKFNPEDAFTYCLYWNISHSQLLQEIDPEFDGSLLSME